MFKRTSGSRPRHRAFSRARRLRSLSSMMALVSLGVVASLGLGVAAPANAADWGPYLEGFPHPDYPDITVYYDEAGEGWTTRTAAADSNNMAKRNAAALLKAQAVPGSYWKASMDAAKAGTSKLGTPAKVMELGNLTRYSPGAVLVKEGTIGAGAPGVGKAMGSFKVPATGLGTVNKVVGGVGLPLMGLEVGLMMGNGATRLFGFKDDMVCAENNGILSTVAGITNGVDCGAFDNALEEAQRNIDQAEVLAAQKLCHTQGLCVDYLGAVADPVWSGGTGVCLLLTSPLGGSLLTITLGGGGALNILGSTANAPVTLAECKAKGMATTTYARGSAATGAPTSFAIRQGGVTQSFTPAADQYTRANPMRGFSCKTVAQTGEGYVSISTPWRESDGEFPAIKCPDVPPGKIAASTEIQQTTEGGTPQTVFKEPTTPEYQAWAGAYPECSDGTCLLDLRQDAVSCFTATATCADWFTETDRDTRYSCKYGTHAMPLTECFIYAELFKPDSLTTGKPWADPETGQPLGGPSSTPVGGALMGKPVQPADKPRECFPTGWDALNPVNWVLQPVQCALEWAFVPRQSVVDAAGLKISNAWAETSPGRVIDAIANWDIEFDVSGCDGLPFPFTYGPTTTNIGIPSACPGTALAPFAEQMRMYGSIVILVLSALQIRKFSGASIGFNT